MFEFIRQLFGARPQDLDAAILRHTQGATVSHAGPFVTLQVPVLPMDEVSPLYPSHVIPFYMKGLSQFGPDEQSAFRQIHASITDQLITTLLSDFNWRSRTAATYFAIILDRRDHADHIGRLLLRSDVCYVGAAYCRYMAQLGTPEAVDYLNRYLGYYLTRSDLGFDQTDALAALRYIDSRSGSRHEDAHSEAIAAMARARPTFLTHVSVQRLSDDLEAALRLRHTV